MGPQNAVIGQDNPVQLPQTQVPEQDLTREKQMASFASSEEFARLKEVFNQRISSLQQYLPGSNGTAINLGDLSNEERGHRWMIADGMIKEFQGVIDAYEQASEVIKSANEPA